MPASPAQKMSPAAWLVLALLSLPIFGFLFLRGGKVILGAVILVFAIGALMIDRRLKNMATSRHDEDIGTFARAFDRRNEPFDPHVVRAVWDALQPYTTFRGGSLPLRPTDRIDQDLGIDWDDIDMGIAQEVAERAGRSLANVDSNPLYGRVSTVGDLVRLISSQPPRAG
jgi:hypothetical protein